jgi:hypothetical protein
MAVSGDRRVAINAAIIRTIRSRSDRADANPADRVAAGCSRQRKAPRCGLGNNSKELYVS